MKINVTIKRSDEWVKQQRIATGENVPPAIKCEIDTSELTAENRNRVLDWQGSYQDIESLTYDYSLSPNRYSHGYGSYDFLVDSAEPTVGEINTAIEAAFAKLDKRREEKKSKDEKREQERLEEIAKKEELKKKTEEARLLLTSELKQIDDYKKRVDILGEFLAEVPLDSLRGTLKKIAISDEKIAKLRKEVEDASTTWIFTNRDDEEDDDE